MFTGKCVKDRQGFLVADPVNAGLEIVYENGDLNEDELDDSCGDGFTLVYEEGKAVDGETVSQTVIEDNCGQFCVPNFILPMIANIDSPIVPGNCPDAGYESFIAQSRTQLFPGTPDTFIDVYYRPESP